MSTDLDALRIDATIVGPVIELRYASHGAAVTQLRRLREHLSQREELLALAREFVEFAAGGGNFSYPLGSLQRLHAAIARATGVAT